MKEIDEDFTEEELDGIIAEVFLNENSIKKHIKIQIDCDGSGTIDFDEFCKIMT